MSETYTPEVADSFKKMSPKLFREIGYLQELNRQFLHPLGLAIVNNVDSNGEETLGFIRDSRDDPEGMAFTEETVNDPDFARKADYIEKLQDQAHHTRLSTMGWAVQPWPRP